jgi:hypothetical protein
MIVIHSPFMIVEMVSVVITERILFFTNTVWRHNRFREFHRTTKFSNNSLATNEFESESSVYLYPNPTSNLLQIADKLDIPRTIPSLTL